MKTSLKSITPSPLWQVARNLRNNLVNAALWPAATFHPWRRASVRLLAELKDKHRGERCFIIGNGPSLKHTDLSKLKNEFTFGMNRFYLMFPDLGFTTSYFACINSLVIEQSAQELRTLPMPKFFSWRSRHLIQPTADTAFLHTTYLGAKFSQDARQRLWEGATVTYVTLQLAFHMGFQQAILIGVDHTYQTAGLGINAAGINAAPINAAPNTTVVSQGDDPNHFHPGYFGKGYRWQLPDLETSERAYRMARQAYESAGRQVIDATVGGKLAVFPKTDYASLF